MSLKLTSITLNTPHLQAMLEFYKIMGLQFVETKVDKGSEVHRAKIDGVEVSIYSIQTQEKVRIPQVQISFALSSLDQKVTELSRVPGAMCILDPTEMPDGKKAIVLDPDGRAVELKEIS